MAKKNFKELFDPKESKWGGINLPMFLAALVVVAIMVLIILIFLMKKLEN